MRRDNQSRFDIYDDDPLRAMPGVLNETLFECLNLIAGWFTRKKAAAPGVSEGGEPDGAMQRLPASRPWTPLRWQDDGLER